MPESNVFQYNVHYNSHRLLKKLEGTLNAPVTVIEAPSGFGKTTAVWDYFVDKLPEDMPVYWWSAAEGAPEFSWTRLCRECEKIDSATGKQLLSVGFPRLMSAWEIGHLISGLNCDMQSVLVLDDFHFLQKELPRTVVSALLSYVGTKLHIVIITQTARPFPLSFFEQAGTHYIQTEDLRLTREDVRRYCRLCRVAVSEAETDQLYEYTEGWIVAVYLTVQQMRRGEGPSPGLSLLQLMEKIVWKDMSHQGRNLFLHIALFSGVTIEQICFLLQADPLPESVLALLEDTPFIRYEAEERRYVPHAILREMLLRRLKAADSRTKIRCYSRAGAWYARAGETLYAVSCFFEVRDYEAILSLSLTHLTMARIDGEPFARLAAELLDECPIETKCKYPISLLRIAYALIGADRREEAGALLSEIKSLIGQVPAGETERNALLGEWMLVSAFLEFPDVLKMEPVLQKAAEMIGGRCRTLPAGEPFAFGLPLMIFFHRRPGQLEKEIKSLSIVVDLYNVLTGVNSGADVLLEAEAALYRGYLSEAELTGYKAAFMAEGSGQWSMRTGVVNLMAQLAFKLGSNNDLSQYIKELEEAVGTDAMCPFVSQMLQTDYYMWLGLTELIPKWIRSGRAAFHDAPSWIKVYLMYYRLGILLQEEEYVQLLGTAEAAIAECRELGYLMVEIYMSIIAAVGSLKTGQERKAFSHVREALARARPDGIYLPFMEFSCMLGNLVKKAFFELGEGMPEEIAANAQIIADNWKLVIRIISESDNLPYGLTKRELEVATLAAKGMSNKEIAANLFISEATVKFHLRAVFSKLDIDRRSKLAGILE
ncbi:MAG: LuxR C-terminal-related transcriptional regulator [Clostridiales bacterium]|nr:LuxR C-terminal-related transcriptional regulator [Clostridiales bacterium]